jgi:hypothetical protein
MLHGEDIDFVNKLKERGIEFELMDVDGLIYRRHATNITNDRKALHQGLVEAIRRKLARARTKSASA